ncbi:PIR protein [Plasmodium ovale]|uniref:PIR protein n=1 Tax=Plasmodium ovale TaxID=36330 RepID=A0A1C3KKJ7_PLAOA|nr:PIR protein [Plasmodium ovale]
MMNQKIEDQYPLLKKMPLNLFYAILDNVSSESENTDVCVTISSKYADTPGYLLCKKFYNIAKIIESILEICNIPQDKYCDYLNYWLHEKITQINPNNENIKRVEMALRTIMKSINPGIGCMYKKFNYNEGEFTHLKKLHDYSANFYWIRENLRYAWDFYDYAYCVYLKDGMDFYNSIIKYAPNKSEDYVLELKYFIYRYNDNQLSHLKERCRKVMPNLEIYLMNHEDISNALKEDMSSNDKLFMNHTKSKEDSIPNPEFSTIATSEFIINCSENKASDIDSGNSLKMFPIDINMVVISIHVGIFFILLFLYKGSVDHIKDSRISV